MAVLDTAVETISYQSDSISVPFLNTMAIFPIDTVAYTMSNVLPVLQSNMTSISVETISLSIKTTQLNTTLTVNPFGNTNITGVWY